MPRRTVSQLYRTWAFGPEAFARPRAARLELTLCEDRLAPAALPSPTLLSPAAPAGAFVSVRPTAANDNTTIDYVNPQVVANPADPLTQVMVATQVVNYKGVNTLTAVTQSTNNGGRNWTPVAALPSGFRDPTLVFDAVNPNLSDSSSASVSVGRDGTAYFVYLAHNAAKTSGAVLFAKAAAGSAPTAAVKIYQWVGTDPALNPTVAVDTNTGSFTDPVTGNTYIDPLVTAASGQSRAVYIAWNGNATTTPLDIGNATDAPKRYNPNPILAAVSIDDGTTWTNPTPVSDGAYLPGSTAKRGTTPQIAFAPGTSGAPGSVAIVWAQQVDTKNYARVEADSTATVTAAGSVKGGVVVAASTPVPVFDAVQDGITLPNGSKIDQPVGTPVSVTVTADQFGAGFTLKDLSVNVALIEPDLSQIQIILTAPNMASVVLVNNRVQADGSTPTKPTTQPLQDGLPASPAQAFPDNGTEYNGLGVQHSVRGNTVFSDYAARRINDSAFPYIGAYRAEGAAYTGNVPFGPYILGTLGYADAAPADLAGDWVLTVIDYRNDRPSNGNVARRTLEAFSLVFADLTPGLGTDTTVGGVAAPIGTDFTTAPLGTSAGTEYPVISPVTGVQSTVVVAFDDSLGAFSPYAGSLYVAYTAAVGRTTDPLLADGGPVVDTNIQLVRAMITDGGVTQLTNTRVNDDSVDDNRTEGNRPQFTPAVAVDASTGTVVASWYDARLDANKTRAATFVATSIDGGPVVQQTRSTRPTGGTRRF